MLLQTYSSYAPASLLSALILQEGRTEWILFLLFSLHPLAIHDCYMYIKPIGYLSQATKEVISEFRRTIAQGRD